MTQDWSVRRTLREAYIQQRTSYSEKKHMIMMIEVCKQLMDVDNEGLKRYVVDNNMVFLGLAEEFS